MNLNKESTIKIMLTSLLLVTIIIAIKNQNSSSEIFGSALTSITMGFTDIVTSAANFLGSLITFNFN